MIFMRQNLRKTKDQDCETMSWKNILRKGDAWEMSQMGYDPEDSSWYGDEYTEADRLLEEKRERVQRGIHLQFILILVLRVPMLSLWIWRL